jgi:hypothetical protein
MSDNPASSAVVPRTSCGTAWPTVALTALAFTFAVLLVDRGVDVRGASTAAISIVAAVLAAAAVRLPRLDVRVTRPKGGQVPGII